MKNPLLQQMSAKKRMPKDLQKKLKKEGWKIYDFYMEYKAGNLWVDIEFCIGDFCVGIYSAKGKWLLEPKKRCEEFIEAIAEAFILIQRAKNGERWIGDEID